MPAKKKPPPQQDYDDLNKIKVPLTKLRWELSEISKTGITEYPLGDLLLTIQMLIRQKEE